jgi:hypothetical protein
MAQLNTDPALAAERDMARLWEERLAAVCTQMGIDHAALVIQDRGLTISVEYEHKPIICGETDQRYAALCVAKLFTSTLIALLVLQQKLAFTSLLNDVLPESLRAGVLQGISVAHLLAHSHGLGCIGLDAAPTDSAGFIDAEAVVESLQEGGRIFAPGKFFSYGTAGFILLGCIIEHLTNKPFGEVLHEQILARLSHGKCISQSVDYSRSDIVICPSSGKGLSLSMIDLLAFADSFVDSAANALALPAALLAEILSLQQQLPGWSPIFSGCGLGWKNFANGWYGHNGIDAGQLMYLRINRTSNSAICLAAKSTRQNPAALPSLLFRTACPSLCFSTTRQPRIVNEPLPFGYDAIVGIFGRGHMSFHIALQHERLLVEIRTTTVGHTVIAHHCYLRAAEENIYFLEKPWQNIVFLQLITDEHANRYLWDHTQLWPELIARDSSGL